jgi:hypothetical protein
MLTAEQDARRRERAERAWRIGVKGNEEPPNRSGPDGMKGSGEGYAAAGGRARGQERGGVEAGVPVQVDACVLLCGLNDFKKVWLLVFNLCVCLGVCASVHSLQGLNAR